jgi:hypothetical protein
MTIAAGFRCYDGVVLCTDSEHTSGQSKFYQKKIFQIEAENAKVYLAGAGDDLYIKSAAERIESAIRGKLLNLEQIKVASQKVVSSLYKKHFARSRQVKDPNAPSMCLLLAVKVNQSGIKREVAIAEMDQAKTSGSDADHLQKIKEYLDQQVANYRPGEPKAMLYRLAETGGISSIDDEDDQPMVTGTEVSEALMKEITSLLFREYSVSVYTMRHLAAHLIQRVAAFSAYCGGSAQVACLADAGPSYLENLASPDAGRDWIGDILADLPFIVAHCVSGEDVGPSIRVLEEAVSKAAEIRKKFLGQHHPMETDGWLR